MHDMNYERDLQISTAPGKQPFHIYTQSKHVLPIYINTFSFEYHLDLAPFRKSTHNLDLPPKTRASVK